MVTVQETAGLMPDITGDQNFCDGETIALDAGAGYTTYEWSVPGGSQMLNVTASGTYTVTVTDGSGCTGIDQVTVTEFAAVTPQITGSTSFCVGSSTTLGLNGTYVDYQWTGGFDTPTIDVNTPGDYSVIVTDINGCTGTTMVNVVQDTELNPTIAGDLIYCAGLSTTLDAGSGFDTYTWEGGQMSQTITVSTPGSYTVTVSDAGGCTGSETVVVDEAPLPVPVIDGPTIFCEGSTTTLDAGGGFDTYLWSDGSINQTLEVATAATIGVTVTDTQGCVGEAQVQTTVNALPAVSILGDLTFCPGSSTILDAGSGFDTYQWNDPANSITQTIEVNDGQNYEVIVTDANGCSNMADVTTVIATEPVAVAGDPQELSCSVTTVTLDGSNSSSGVTYLWEGPGIDATNETSPSPQVIEAGMYSLTVTNTEGCTAVDNVAVTVDPSTPQADAGADATLTCTITMVTIGGAGSSTGPEYTYLWTGPGIDATNETMQFPGNITVGGLYTLVVTQTDAQGGTCDSPPSTVLVEVNQTQPVADVEFQLASQLDCNNGSVVLSSNGSTTGPDIIYEWSLNGNVLDQGPTYEAGQPGTYTLTVMDNSNGCSAAATIDVNQDIEPPLAQAGDEQTIDCSAADVTLNGAGSTTGANITYNWTGPVGGIVGDPASLTIDATLPGIYTLTVMNTDNGCSMTDQVTVLQNTNGPIADAGPSLEFDCQTEELTLSASGTTGADAFTWTDTNGSVISQSQSAVVTQTGVYYLEALNTANNCVSLDSVFIGVNTNVPSDAAVSVAQPSCFGENDGAIIIDTIIGGTPPYLYSLDGSGFFGFEQFTNLTAGSYSLFVEDAAGCEWETSVTVTQPAELNLIIAGAEDPVQLGDSIDIQALINIPIGAVDTLIWETPFPFLNCLEEDCFELRLNQLFNSARIAATLVDTNGCVATDETFVQLIKDRNIYIPNAFSPDNIRENDVFMIHGGQGVERVLSFQVYNRWGEVVFEDYNFQPNNPRNGWNGEFKNKKLNPGVFVYQTEVLFTDGEKIRYVGDVTLIH